MESEYTEYDLCIIGSGMFGSAAARYASSNPGFNVIVIGPEEPEESEKFKRSIFSSHYDEGRIISCLDGDDIVYHELSKGLGIRYNVMGKQSGVKFYNPIGYMCIAQKDSHVVSEILRNARERDVPVQDLTGEKALERFPFLALNPDERVLLSEQDGYISARKITFAQKKIAEAQGCVFIPEVVSKVEPFWCQNEAIGEKTLQLHKVITESGQSVFCKRILICTGAFTTLQNLLLAESDEGELRADMPQITVYKETVAMLKVTEKDATRLGMMPTMSCYRRDGLKDCHTGVYILPPMKYPDNNYYIKVGHLNNEDGDVAETLEEVKEWYLSKGDPELVKALSSIFLKLVPGLSVIGVEGATCVTCRSTSGVPYIDKVSDTVSIAVAGNGSGAKIADEVGRIAAELSLTGNWVSDIPKSTFKAVWK